jgi:hypothetical protein
VNTTGLYVQSAPGLRRRDQAVRRLVRKMRNVMPWLTDADAVTCRSWAEIEILASRAYMILSTVGLINRDGQPLRLLGDFRLLRQTQLSYANALAMTPSARAQLRLTEDNGSFDLAQIASETQNTDDAGDDGDQGESDGAAGAQHAAAGAAARTAGTLEDDHEEEG